LDLVSTVKRLNESNDYLQEHSERARKFAHTKLIPDQDLKERFLHFLENLRPCK
jgi:hypothetical protein